jgi:hypothetical protein
MGAQAMTYLLYYGTIVVLSCVAAHLDGAPIGSHFWIMIVSTVIANAFGRAQGSKP